MLMMMVRCVLVIFYLKCAKEAPLKMTKNATTTFPVSLVILLFPNTLATNIFKMKCGMRQKDF